MKRSKLALRAVAMSALLVLSVTGCAPAQAVSQVGNAVAGGIKHIQNPNAAQQQAAEQVAMRFAKEHFTMLGWNRVDGVPGDELLSDGIRPKFDAYANQTMYAQYAAMEKQAGGANQMPKVIAEQVRGLTSVRTTDVQSGKPLPSYQMTVVVQYDPNRASWVQNNVTVTVTDLNNAWQITSFSFPNQQNANLPW